MNRCFVIQPFDRGPFDKRFDDVVSPAVRDAGLEAYRVDRDVAATIPINAIETGIRDAAACIADISTDNPNVWFELGYALACRKPVVMICSSERGSPFPFDVQHRTVISYDTDSTSDFAKLRQNISDRLRTALAKETRVQSLAQASLKETEGLEPHEIAALVIIAENNLDPDSFPSAFSLKQDMREAGFTEIATVLAVNVLIAKHFVDSTEVKGYNESYLGYHLLEAGTRWLLENRHRLVLRERAEANQVPSVSGCEGRSKATRREEDLPF